jgi:hypothetical protein
VEIRICRNDATASAVLRLDGDEIVDARVAVGALFDRPTRLKAVEAALVGADAGRAARQFHVMSADGRSAAHTGGDCVDWCGHRAVADISVAGNMLAGPQVLDGGRQCDAELPGSGRPCFHINR